MNPYPDTEISVMIIKLEQNAYGKNAVHLSKIIRHADHHEFRQVIVDISLQGNFEPAHIAGDNSNILPTDTQKNTVYVLAKEFFVESIEAFGLCLAGHFSTNNPQVTKTTITITEQGYTRMSFNGQPHPHAFTGNGPERHIAVIEQQGSSVQVTAGIKDMLILKTTDSGFEHFIRDQYTTLKETNDRILATQCEVTWTYQAHEHDYAAQYAAIRTTLLQTFAFHQSLSVQHTLFAMGEAVLQQHEVVREIALKMPNKHHILFNLEQFGIANQNDIFIATNEPYGLITATLSRED